MATPKQIYTAGSTVTGIVHLGSKNPERIQEVQVSLVCIVRSIYHRYLGGHAHDIRKETVQLIHRDQTLWAVQNGEASCPPVDLAFEMALPEVGNDRRAKNPDTPLPPSFHAGKHRGWRNAFTYGTPIGFIKYHVKVSVARRGLFNSKERAFCPFVFLPPSSPPPLLPTPPETISDHGLNLPDDLWQNDSASAGLRHSVFNSSGGQASLTLWIPRIPSFPRLTRIPFVLCLALQTQRVNGAPVGQPPEDILPPAPQLDKASLFLRQRIRCCARSGVQMHTRTLDGQPTDNMLHGITPQEGPWTVKTDDQGYWEKGFMWRGLWTFRDVPNFQNRQLTWGYALVAEVPVKGLGNSVHLVSQPIEVSTGITVGTNLPQSSAEDMLDLPPNYFEVDGTMSGEDDDVSPEDEKD